MEYLKISPKSAAAVLLSFALALALMSCDGSSSSNGTDEPEHRLVGLIVKDLDQGTFRAEAIIDRNDSLLATASLVLDTTTLILKCDVYTTEPRPAVLYEPGPCTLTVSEGSEFNQTVTTTLPGDLTLEVTDPANRLNTGGGQVSVEFTASSAAEGYAVATVRRPLTYYGAGHSAWVTSLTTAATISPEAFRLSGGALPDTGWYYIYVYAYTDVPDSALSEGVLPVKLPSQLPDNITETDFTGHFGAVVVSPHDSVYVPLQ